MSGISLPAVPVAVPVTPAGATATITDPGAQPGEFASLMAGLLGEDAPATDAPVDPALDPVADAPVDASLVDPALLVVPGTPAATPAPITPTAPGTVDTKDPKNPTVPLPTPGPIERTGPLGPGSRPVDDGGEVPRTYGCTTGVVVKGPRAPGLPGVPTQPVAAVDTPRLPPVNGPSAPSAPLPAAAATTDAAASGAATVPPAAATADPLAGLAPAIAQPVVPTAGTQVPPAAPLAAAAPAAPVHAGPSHIPDQVTAQVFPEIGRLAVRASSAGEGIHRITLNLHPETLGDVRVTLVVRGGEMKISIHAANEAGRIMADSIPELRRLLGSAGADAIVAVRDTGAGGATLNTADQGSTSSDLDRSGYDAHQQGRDTHGRDARTRDGHIATDGSNSGARGIAPGPHDLVRATRSAGVDVTV